MIKLRKINPDNIWKVTNLTVHDSQKHFVASNTDSLLEAYLAIIEGQVALPFAIYHDDLLVGFVMFGYGSSEDADEPLIADGNYLMWRFMIDQQFQGRGYGKEALKASLDYIRTYPCGPAQYCWLSYEPENTAARSLYASMGFNENGETCGNEIVTVIKL